MIRALAGSVVAALVIGGTALAEDGPLPDLFDVTGVNSNDVLNVRSAPDADAEVIGSLDHDARDIEIVAVEDGWGRVNQGERSGWAAMRFLTRKEATWQAGGVPSTLTCFGTEPFWSLGFKGDGVTWSTPDEMLEVSDVAVLGGEIAGDIRRGLSGAGEGVTVHAVITPGACSDGMSDRGFGLTATVILDEGEGPRLLHGCCSIAP